MTEVGTERAVPGRRGWRDPTWRAHALFAAIAVTGVLGLWQLTRERHPAPQDFGVDYYWPLWLALVWSLAVLLHLQYAAGRFTMPATQPVAPPADAAPAHLELLTGREREVIALVAEGYANKQIATRLGISERTARTHVSNILRKLAVPSRTHAALAAVRAGDAEPPPPTS